MIWRHREALTWMERAAHGMLLLAALGAGVAGYRAWMVTPPDASMSVLAPESAPGLGVRVAYPLRDALRMVERDPFHPERRAPAARYLLPEENAEATVSDTRTGRRGSMRLLGTALSAENGGFAMCQIGNDPPRILHVGDTLGGLTLRRIDRASAAFSDSEGALVTLQLPGATAGADS